MANRIDEQLRAKGFNPEQIKQQVKGHIQNSFGGNMQNYVDAIRTKPQLSDPQAAAAMRVLAPQMFGDQLGAHPEHPGKMAFDFGQTAPIQAPGMHPAALNMLNAIGAHQAANPFTLPIPPGTKMRWQVNDEEAMRAQAAQEALANEKWDWQKEQAELDRQAREREFGANEAYRQARLALEQMAKTAGAVPAGPEGLIPGGSYRTDTQTERDRIYASEAGQGFINNLKANPQITLAEWKANVLSRKPQLIHEGINIDEFMSFIEEQYVLYHLMEAQNRVGKNVKPWEYGADLQKTPSIVNKYNPWAVKKPEKAASEDINSDDY